MSLIAQSPWPLRALVAAGAMGLCLALVGGLALLVAMAGLGRLEADLDILAATDWGWRHRDDPEFQRWFGLGLLSAATGLGGGAVMLLRKATPLHGAARWAREGEIAAAGLRGKSGIILGRHAGRLLVFGGDEHVLLAAPTRSGKGVGVVIPNLLSWPHSVVVLDVKRENWTATAGFRAAHGQRVLMFDPLDPEGRTARFNPLGHVPRDDPFRVIDELQKIAAMLFPTAEHADPFWAEAARTGFIGVGAYVAQLDPSLPFSLGSIYAELSRGDPRRRLPQVIGARAADGRPLWPSTVQALSDFCSASDNTFASIKQTITAKMGLWIHPRVCAATEVSDFSLADLKRQRISIYLGTSPDNLSRLAPLYNLFFQQLVDLNTRRPPGADEPYPVLIILDEFARLGQAKVLAHAFSYAAGYGLRLMSVLQSPSQLRGLYGADLADEIISNCGVEVVFAPKDIDVARRLSERLGFYGLPSKTRSRPAGFSSGRRSQSESLQKRALMLPQELLQLPNDQMIVLRSGLPPVKARKITYWRERAFLERLTPPPQIAPFDVGEAAPQAFDAEIDTAAEADEMCAATAEAGYHPPPTADASEEEWTRWSLAYLEKSRARAQGASYGRG